MTCITALRAIAPAAIAVAALLLSGCAAGGAATGATPTAPDAPAVDDSAADIDLCLKFAGQDYEQQKIDPASLTGRFGFAVPGTPQCVLDTPEVPGSVVDDFSALYPGEGTELVATWLDNAEGAGFEVTRFDETAGSAQRGHDQIAVQAITTA